MPARLVGTEGGVVSDCAEREVARLEARARSRIRRFMREGGGAACGLDRRVHGKKISLRGYVGYNIVSFQQMRRLAGYLPYMFRYEPLFGPAGTCGLDKNTEFLGHRIHRLCNASYVPDHFFY